MYTRYINFYLSMIRDEIAWWHVIRLRRGEFASLSHVERSPTRFLRVFLARQIVPRNYVFGDPVNELNAH